MQGQHMDDVLALAALSLQRTAAVHDAMPVLQIGLKDIAAEVPDRVKPGRGEIPSESMTAPL